MVDYKAPRVSLGLLPCSKFLKRCVLLRSELAAVCQKQRRICQLLQQAAAETAVRREAEECSAGAPLCARRACGADPHVLGVEHKAETQLGVLTRPDGHDCEALADGRDPPLVQEHPVRVVGARGRRLVKPPLPQHLGYPALRYDRPPGAPWPGALHSEEHGQLTGVVRVVVGDVDQRRDGLGVPQARADDP
eukprot:CAMPEP_0204599176 /NCGR_PEP_ID=MMETSP0661-20131031/54687_1 /ASSEMBLY_ACC=CAM_ASM_000606 /TAXON_ID=109239 /ORGANISM="Alexandrium margalefi, Strain AMGDE01CS-322" /LENGTH=191 /DNA_ID=CAMNT_0051609891 /DNA_START=204 /DNA_END=779 /DNA_ORIENTATION=-